MNLHEYQGKALFAEYGLPVSVGQAVDTPEAAEAAAKEIGGDKWVVKAQVHAGGRGKAGGVKLVDSPAEARAFYQRFTAGQAQISKGQRARSECGPAGRPFADLFLFFCHDDLRGRVSRHVEGGLQRRGQTFDSTADGRRGGRP